jgi:hypothetical protein
MTWITPATDLHDCVWAVFDGDLYRGLGVVDDFGFVAFINKQAFIFWLTSTH